MLAVDESNGVRNLTHERGEFNGKKRRQEKGRQEAIGPALQGAA